MSFLLEIFRFTVSGFLTTCLSVIFMFVSYMLSKNHILSNFLGYLIGIFFSYLFGKRFVFRSASNRSFYELLRFVLWLMVAYIANLVVLQTCLYHFRFNPALSYALAMAVYAGLNFLFQKKMVFSL